MFLPFLPKLLTCLLMGALGTEGQVWATLRLVEKRTGLVPSFSFGGRLPQLPRMPGSPVPLPVGICLNVSLSKTEVTVQVLDAMSHKPGLLMLSSLMN